MGERYEKGNVRIETGCQTAVSMKIDMRRRSNETKGGVGRLPAYSVYPCIKLTHHLAKSSCPRYLYPLPLPSRQRQRQQLPKIWHPQPSNRIPPHRRIPTRIWNNPGAPRHRLPCLPIHAITAHGAPGSDISETLEADAVEPGVEVAELFLTGAEAGIVEKGDYGGEDRGGGGRAAGEPRLGVDDYGVAELGGAG